jgi:hypothetical protein
MTSSGPLSFGYVHIFKHTADLRRFLCVLMWGWSSYLWKCTIIGGESPSSSTSVWHQAFDPVPGLPVSKWFKSPSWTGWIISCYIILYYICNWGTLQTTALTYCYSVFFLKKKWLWTTFQLGCPSLAEIWDLRSVLILQVLFAIVCPAAVSNWIHWDPGIHRMVLVIETTKFHQ